MKKNIDVFYYTNNLRLLCINDSIKIKRQMNNRKITETNTQDKMLMASLYKEFLQINIKVHGN